MKEYDLDKIRIVCLTLMGWKHVDGSAWWNEAESYSAFWDIKGSDMLALPNPTESLDDALPLMEKYVMELQCTDNSDRGKWLATTDDHTGYAFAEAFADSAPLAVCLCALKRMEIDTDGFLLQKEDK